VLSRNNRSSPAVVIVDVGIGLSLRPDRSLSTSGGNFAVSIIPSTKVIIYLPIFEARLHVAGSYVDSKETSFQAGECILTRTRSISEYVHLLGDLESDKKGGKKSYKAIVSRNFVQRILNILALAFRLMSILYIKFQFIFHPSQLPYRKL